MIIRRVLTVQVWIIAFFLVIPILTGCSTTSGDALEKRLTAMSDDDLISYYQGVNDRLKAIQEGTREADRQGTVIEQDPLAKMPYIIGGEAWELQRTLKRIKRELDRRNLSANSF